MTTVLSPAYAPARPGPPAWLVLATGALALGCLAMAVAETSLWMHYLIDAGESVSLFGLAFILLAGVYLYGRGRLRASLPLTLPWLLFPVITQGDQIIDNLSIGWMQLISHVLLGAIFGTPVAILVLGLRYGLAPTDRTRAWTLPPAFALVPGLRQLAAGRVREGSAVLAAILLTLEMWVAVRFLGLLMVATLMVMTWGVLVYGFWRTDEPAATAPQPARGERLALAMLVGGVLLSVGLFVGFKNRPGAYQGSPSYFMDPSQENAGFDLRRIAVPESTPALPRDADNVRSALTAYARAFERLLSGYYVLDRNYNYHFHNELFLRDTPLLPEYRKVGLSRVAEAEALYAEAAQAAAAARTALAPGDPLRALLDDVAAYADFTFDRVPVLTRMSAQFEQTRAGLQHATHLYEGEGKVLGVRLDEILNKHRRVLSAPAVAPVTRDFTTISRAVHDAYANRIVGF